MLVHHRIKPGLLTQITPRMPLVEKVLLVLPLHLRSSLMLMGFVFLNRAFSVWYIL